MAQPANNAEVGRLINLMPVGLKEAAIDSPTARATVVHYCEQLELLEKWIDDYLKATNRLIAESTTLENVLNSFTSHAALPTSISETMMDHDYSVLAIKRYGESAKDYFMSTVSVVKRLSTVVCDPIRHFQTAEIKPFKEARRLVDQTQKNYDALHSKFMALTKTKEPSSIREDAFQLHEARKQYLQASMNFFQIAPHFRFSLDKLIVRIFCDQYKEMRLSRDSTFATFQRNTQDMERVQGWVREMEDSERIFKKELSSAKKQLEESAELAVRPSRELEDYATSNIPGLGHSHTISGAGLNASPDKKLSPAAAEKQGWLYLRTYSGKPLRVIWIKRWAFVRNGVFGWLVQGARAGGVEESERIGVLLCSVRPAHHEERRFCFELKTNKHTIVLQTETHAELLSWIREIEAAKAKAVANPASSDAVTPGVSEPEPAFAITAPPIPEFGTLVLKATEPGSVDETTTVPRSDTLPPSSTDTGSQVDLLRRATAFDDGSRDHASRIMSKLDLHRRTPTGPQVSSPAAPAAGGGIASLIAASHGSMPVGPSLPMVQSESEIVFRKPLFTLALRDMPPSTLSPSTLTSVPAPTNLSKSAIIVSGERGMRGSVTSKNGIPNSILANTWGSSNGSYVNRFDRSGPRASVEGRLQPSPLVKPTEQATETGVANNMMTMDLVLPPSAAARSRTPSPSKGRRQTGGLDRDIDRPKVTAKLPDFPTVYPIQLKSQDAQFRLLFPNARPEERLVLVFRATWNPNDQQEFPGRVYVTTKDLYFYSNHFGLVLTSVVALSSVDEVTAAPGKDCDFLFMHFKEEATPGLARRVTIKVFLEPLKLLQRRLNFLAQNSADENPLELEDIIKRLIKMENEVVRRTPSLESWEDVSPDTPVDVARSRSRANTLDIRAPVRVDRNLFPSLTDRDGVTKFKLPAQPVKYSPAGYSHLAIEREYDLSPKALFHVMFGDKSLLWQLLQHERKAENLKQGPWTSIGEGRLYRDFEFSVPTTNFFGQERISVVRDYQFVDVNNDHLCYVVTDKRTAWHLPNQKMYRLVSKIVITHMAKSKCKLAIYTKVEWLQEPWYLKNVLDRQAMYDLDLDAQDIADLVNDQVRKLGAFSRTKKAIQIFGQIGQSSDVTQLELEQSAIAIEMRRVPKNRTMTGLVVQDARSVTQGAVGTLLEGLFEFARWMQRTVSANAFILLLLIASGLHNSWFMLRDSHGWYHDRSTANFLKRLGVGPNHIMSKAVYLNDMHEVMTASGTLPDPSQSLCYQAFHDEHYLTDLNIPLVDSTKDDASHGSAKRIQDARQHLGHYRHDLLVAMRVVNSMEKEIIRSEWEDWLSAEHRKCRAIEPMIEQANNGSRKDVESSKEVKKWYDTYCSSCGDEYARMKVL